MCDACLQTHLHDTFTTTRCTENVRRDYGPLQKIVSDVKGPIHIVGIKGVQYYILYMAVLLHQASRCCETILNTFKQLEYDITAIRKDLRIIEAFKRDNASYHEEDVMPYMTTSDIKCTAQSSTRSNSSNTTSQNRSIQWQRDSASYYEDKDVIQYMKTRGMHVQRTSPYTHHQGDLTNALIAPYPRWLLIR